MEIRFAIAQDVPGIITLLRQEGKVHHAERPDLFRSNAQKYSPSQILELLNCSDRPIFVAVEEDKVLGYGFCAMEYVRNHAVLNDRVTLFIEDICVLESYRRQGIGTLIYDQILRYAKGRGCNHVTLNVWSCNAGALKFFESLGMKPQMIAMEAAFSC